MKSESPGHLYNLIRAFVDHLKCTGDRVVSGPNFGSRGLGFESCCWWNSTRDSTGLHCTQSSIITFPLSRYDLDNVERDVKH